MSALFQGRAWVSKTESFLGTAAAVAIGGNINPEYYYGGLPYVEGRKVLFDITLPITHYHQGLPFCSNGAIAAEIDNFDRYEAGAFAITAAQRASIGSGLPPLIVANGVLYQESDEYLKIATNPIEQQSAFDDGFDEGFD